MNDVHLQMWLLDGVAGVTGLGLNWFVQSSLLLGVGLVIGRLLRSRGPAAQSVIYRTTLVAVLVCPLATWTLALTGVSGWSIDLPTLWTLQDAPEVSAIGNGEGVPVDRAEAVDVPLPAASAFSPGPAAGEATDTFSGGESRDVLPVPLAGDSAIIGETPVLAASGPTVGPDLGQDSSTQLGEASTLLIHRFGLIASFLCLVWPVVTATFLARLASAWRQLWRLRESAVDAEPATTATCGEVATLMQIAAPEVKHSPYLPGPCLAGLRRPAVLLPEVYIRMALRDLLIHEMAHLRRHDCHWNLLRRLTTAVFFFQPLLWKLSRRLEATAEEVCDDHVVQYGGDRQAYAHRLVDIAELSSAPVAAAVVGIVSLRSLLAKRVARILDTSRSLSTRVGSLLLTLVVAGGLLATSVVGLVGIGPQSLLAEAERGVGNSDDAVPVEEPVTENDVEASESQEDEDLITVRGQVVDPQGRPVDGADVYVLRWYWNWGKRKPLGHTKSDEDGRFEISYRKLMFWKTGLRPEQWREASYVAFAPGYGPDWILYDRIPKGEPLTLRLARDDVYLEGRVVDPEGNPVAGAKIAIESIHASLDEDLSAWVELLGAGQSPASAHGALSKGTLPAFAAQRWKGIRTDKDGRFTVPGIGRERVVHLKLSGAEIVTKTIRAATRPMEPIRQPAYDFEGAFSITNYGARFEYRAAASRPIEGVVRDAQTGEPVAGVGVWSNRFSGENISGVYSIKTETDENGRYRIEGMPKGADNQIVVVPADLPYFTRRLDVPAPAGLEPVELDIEIHRGLWVTGTVAAADTGEPVAAKMLYVPFPDNPHAPDTPEFPDGSYRWIQDRHRTQVDGSYRVVALPGRGIVCVVGISEAYPGGQGYEIIEGVEDREAFEKYGGVFAPTPKFPTAVKEINPVLGGPEVVCDFALDQGQTVSLQTVDPDGVPLTGVDVYGLREMQGGSRQMKTDTFNLTAFREGENRAVILYQKERGLGKGLRVKRDDAGATPIAVKLEPCATVFGRLVDGNGEPVRGAQLRFPVSDDHDFGRELGGMATDAKGRFRRDDVPSGLSFNILAQGANIRFAVVAKELAVEPGQTIDLGTIDVTSEDRPAISTTVLPASEISGRVVGPDGKPAAGAHVAAIGRKIQPDRGGDLALGGEVLAEATTGDDGRYRLNLVGASSKTHRYANLIARADDGGLAWQRLDLDAPEVDASFKLPDEEPIRGRLIDAQGQPAAGVRVSIRSVSVTSKTGIRNAGVGFRSMDEPPRAWPQPLTTDEQGRFVIRGVPAGHGVLLVTRKTDKFAPQDVSLNTGMSEERGEHDQTYRSQVKNVKPGEEAVLTLAAAQIFEGVVRYEDTGKPAPHARLTVWASQQQEMGSMISVAGKSDAQGRYRINPNPGVRFGVTAYPPDGAPYLVRRVTSIHWEDGATLKQVDVNLPRGVLVRGKVVETDNGEAVAGATIQYVPETTNNPNTADDILTGWQGIQLSDGDGRFEITVLPGPGRLLAHGPQGEFVLREIASRQLSSGQPGGRRNYCHAIVPVDPQANAEPIDVTVELQRGATITGRLTDEKGEPVKEALLFTRLNIHATSLYWRGFPIEAFGGRFELSGLAQGQEYPVFFLDPKHRLGASAVLKTGGEMPTVVLTPCGQATAKFTDSKGQPISDSRITLRMVVTPGVNPYDMKAMRRGELAADSDHIANIDRTNYWPGPKTDDQGHITFPALIPGATYRLIGSDESGLVVAKEFTVKSRETVDLGEIAIRHEK